MSVAEENTMLRRCWVLFTVLWAVVFLWNGSTKSSGIHEGDVMLATAPVPIGWLLSRAARFVTNGN